ncbi:MAG TPA: GNAT family N-acetyltransferase, partial [Thermoanaerobaculia bacterium]|nr:GNAT family N-acetyltransferase [Thermoanaerobaculia bacterium]
MHYRDSEPGDISQIVEFQIAMALETEHLELDPATCHRGVAAVFERPELGRYVVVEEGGEIIASLLLTFEWSDWRA